MSARVEIENSTARIILTGDLDYSTQSDIHSAIDTALETDSIKDIQVDFTNTTFLDSSVIRALLALQKRAAMDNKPLTLMKCNESIREIFIIGGFDQIFNIL